MQNVLGRIATTLVILCPVIAFSVPESAIQASSIKSSQTDQVKLYLELILYKYIYMTNNEPSHNKNLFKIHLLRLTSLVVMG